MLAWQRDNNNKSNPLPRPAPLPPPQPATTTTAPSSSPPPPTTTPPPPLPLLPLFRPTTRKRSPLKKLRKAQISSISLWLLSARSFAPPLTNSTTSTHLLFLIPASSPHTKVPLPASLRRRASTPGSSHAHISSTPSSSTYTRRRQPHLLRPHPAGSIQPFILTP